MQKTLLASAAMALFLTACGGSSTADNQASSSASATSTESASPTSTSQLNIYNWSDYVDPQTVIDFEKANNVTVRYDYYDSNETLEAKILTGKSGYDLVAPSISHAGRQIQAGAYQKIDKSQISNYNNIDPQLLALMEQVDPGNQYAVPYFWGIITIGINEEKVKAALGGELPENSWDLLFNPEYTNKLKSCGISILDSPTEVFPTVLRYIGKDTHSENPEDLKAAAETIRKVRGDYKRFSSSGYIDDLARGDLCVAMGYNGDINIAARRSAEVKGNKIVALVPMSGFGVWIDSFLIPKDAQNVANAYKYINNTLDPKVAALNGDFVTFAPASKGARALMNPELAKDTSIFPTEAQMANSFVMKPMTPKAVQMSVRLWQGIKAGQ